MMRAALLRRMTTTKTTNTITAARYCCSCFLNANTHHHGNNRKRSKRGRRTLASFTSDTTTTTTTTNTPLRIVSWNVNGLRGTMKKHPHFVKDLYEKTRFDILCVQETKMQEGNVGEMLAVIEDDEDENDDDKGPGGLHHNQNNQLAAHFSCSTARKGYSGVAMITRPDVKFTSKPREGFHQRALDEADFEKTEENLEAFHLFNREGRVMTCELEKAVIINTYVPNSGEGLKRLRERIEVWEPAMKAHVSCLREDMMKEEEEKAIVWVGDFNVAHEKRDLWGNWTQNETSAGFTPEERLAFSNQLKDLRLTDSFRYRHPTADDKFTYWSYRAKSRERNRGWRIDYALVSDTMKENIKDAFIVSDFLGSDHCPLGVELRV